MALSLRDLQEVLSPITQVGKGELTFEVQGVSLTLRALTGEEEIEVQRVARANLQEGDLTDQIGALEYLDKFRNASLGYAIVQVGNLDFRAVTEVETGDKLPSGVAVKIKKHEAIQRVVATWSRNMVVAVFKKFGELNEKMDKEVDALIEFDPVDYDAEISRLEDRIRELKDDKARDDASKNDIRTAIRNQAAAMPKKTRVPASESEEVQGFTGTTAESVNVPSVEDPEREVFDESEAEMEEGEPEEPEPPAPQQPRTPVYARPTPARYATQPSPPQQGEEPPSDAGSPTDAFGEVESSLVDTSDPQVIERENLRIAAQRRKAAPHVAARAVAEDLSKRSPVTTKQATEVPVKGPLDVPPKQENPFPAKEIAIPTIAQPTSKMIDGKQVFAMPTQHMTDRGRPPPGGPVVTPPASRPNPTNNPRFRPPK